MGGLRQFQIGVQNRSKWGTGCRSGRRDQVSWHGQYAVGFDCCSGEWRAWTLLNGWMRFNIRFAFRSTPTALPPQRPSLSSRCLLKRTVPYDSDTYYYSASRVKTRSSPVDRGRERQERGINVSCAPRFASMTSTASLRLIRLGDHQRLHGPLGRHPQSQQNVLAGWYHEPQLQTPESRLLGLLGTRSNMYQRRH